MELLRAVINDLDAPLPERLKAAELVMARTLPKNENLDVSVEPGPKFLQAIQGGIRIESEDDIIDAEVIEDDEVIFE